MSARSPGRLYETLEREVEADYTHRPFGGGRFAFARVALRLTPAPQDAGVPFGSEVPLGQLPRWLGEGVEHGVMAVAQLGLIAGHPVIGVRATLLDAAPRDSNANFIGFAIAAALAFRSASVEGHAVVVEPIMRVEVICPTDCASRIASVLEKRRGSIVGVEERPDLGMSLVEALAPHSEVFFDFFPAVRTITDGRCRARMKLDRYGPTPDQPPVPTMGPSNGGPDLFPPAMGMRA